MSPYIAEFLGTMILILLGNGVVANVVLKGTKGYNSGWIVITAGWALAVFTAVIIAGKFSGAHLNPAVTLALALVGLFSWSSVGFYVLAQLLGAMAGALLVYIFYYDHYQRTEDADAKQATFCTAPAIPNNKLNFLQEMVGTFVLIASVLYISLPNFTTNSGELPGLGALGALPVAFVVFAIGLSLGGTTGYAINPVRDFGPRLIHYLVPINHKGGSGWRYAWIPVLGPLAGASLAASMMLLLR